ncbi:putative sodium bicarbonate cotransporter [Chondrus crispus]|uniref:Putative sodium bicarbonate cotransporter n=1 Tax=Chondrus crispus TaxID=2769 RepID=R7Q0Y4_CHOCR|nr:putative sodium bicarbonate cotransporter [Chondrus crispus]CDF32307.1 putative sodium bicarbonate cotransporter [Chondrus crispus]|eukprot:XP_005711972.1 putative sodium bicarbonate cotransporter [Chondrus crispus]
MCNQSSTSSACIPPAATSASTLRHRSPPALLCEIEPLPVKSVADEIRGHKDLHRVAQTAPLLLNLPPAPPRRILRLLLNHLVDAGQIPATAINEAVHALFGEPNSSAPNNSCAQNSEDAFDTLHQRPPGLPLDADNNSRDPQTSRDTNFRHPADQLPGHWHKNVLGSGFIIPFARLNALNTCDRCVVAIARLTSSCNLGVANGSLVRFVVLVLGPVKELKETKTPFEIARTLSAMFQDDQFYSDARLASSDGHFRDAIRKYLARETNPDPSEQAPSPESIIDKTFARTGKFAGGLIADVRRRYKPSVYKSDWTDGVKDPRSLLKYLSTTVWLFFAIIMPTIAFGALDDDNTDANIGVIETIVSQAFAGLTFATFAGQPLTIVMTTAPITVFIDVLFSWCKTLEIPFLPFYAWTGLWTALILLVLVVTDACYVMKYCGHFTEEIFATLIAALFVSEYIKPLIHVYEDSPTDVFLLAFLLATGTFLIAMALLNFRRSFLLKPIIRQLLSDFGVPISILAMTAVRRIFLDVEAEPLKVPDRIGIVTTSGRSWLVPLFDIQIQYIFLAAVSGALLATLFFLDQNISSMLVNKPENKLKQGPGYYLDLVVVSIIIVVQSVFGMPWTHAALPHSPLHARQLADVEEYEQHGRRYERVIKARETRITGFVTHVFIGLSILAKDALGLIPLSVLYGFFLFLGVGTLDGIAFWDRILLLFTQSEKYPPNHYVRRVKISRIHLYTFVQVLLLVLLWFVKSNFYLGDTVFNTGLLFPFIIALFIPIRLYILPRIFTPAELHALSMEEEENVSDSGITC